MAEARLSLANEIYKEKIRDDYPPTLPPSASLSLSLSLTLMTGHRRKGRLSVLAYGHTVKQ